MKKSIFGCILSVLLLGCVACSEKKEEAVFVDSSVTEAAEFTAAPEPTAIKLSILGLRCQSALNPLL